MNANPYAAPDPAPRAAGDLAPEAAGSHLRIGPRRALTRGWIAGQMARVMLLWFVPVVGVMLAMAWQAFEAVDRYERDVSMLWMLGMIAFVLCALRIQLAGLPSTHPSSHRPGADTAGLYTVSFSYEPRLRHTWFERLESDDIGALWMDGEWLHLDGDRSDIRLHRSAVSSVSRKRFLGSTLVGLGPDTRIDLHEPVGGQTTFWIQIRERIHTPRTRRRAGELRRTLAAWHTDQATPTT